MKRTVWGTEDNLALDFTQPLRRGLALRGAVGTVAGVDRRPLAEPSRPSAHSTWSAQVCRDASLRAGSVRLAAKLASSSVMGGVERLARADRRHAATTEEWDADPWLLNTPGGVVDLTTGALRDHRREDRMTKLATATPARRVPALVAFLGDVTGGDAELHGLPAAHGRLLPYRLTTEHALFFLYGTGANGKSVFVNTLATILGDYATNAPMDTFMETRRDRHPTDMAGLRGARFVSSIETEQGRRWDESKLKALTGGDKVSARFMRQDFFEFFPQFKLFVAGNHKPSIRNVDEAMKRRLHLIPFTVTVPPAKRDSRLPEKLLAERDGILAWAVEGCLSGSATASSRPPAWFRRPRSTSRPRTRSGSGSMSAACSPASPRRRLRTCSPTGANGPSARGEYVGSVKRFSELLATRGFERCRLHGGARGLGRHRPATQATPAATPPTGDELTR